MKENCFVLYNKVKGTFACRVYINPSIPTPIDPDYSKHIKNAETYSTEEQAKALLEQFPYSVQKEFEIYSYEKALELNNWKQF